MMQNRNQLPANNVGVSLQRLSIPIVHYIGVLIAGDRCLQLDKSARVSRGGRARIEVRRVDLINVKLAITNQQAGEACAMNRS